MLPKKSNVLYKTVADKFNVEEDLVKDFISFTFNELRDRMESLDEDRFNVLGLMKIEATLPKIHKEIKYIEQKKKLAKSFDMVSKYNNDLEKLELLKQKRYEDVNRKRECQQKKLEWHKENGDPYGVYKKQLEKNIGRLQEFIDSEK